MDYQKYLQSDEWKEKRDAALEYAHYRCQLCNSGKCLNVHHNTYENLPKEVPRDLIVLCEDCHKRYHIFSSNYDLDCDFWPVVNMGGVLVKGKI